MKPLISDECLPDLHVKLDHMTVPAQENIACVTHGMLLALIPLKDATRLLYAAQVAQQASRAQARIRRKQPAKPPKTADSTEQTSVRAPA